MFICSEYFFPLQADLQQPMKVTGIITQGRQDVDQWTKIFVVHYSSDCKNWLTIKEPSCSEKVHYNVVMVIRECTK